MEATGDVALSLPPEWLLPAVRERLCHSTEISGKKLKTILNDKKLGINCNTNKVVGTVRATWSGRTT